MRCISRYIYTNGLLPSGVKQFQLETDRGLVDVEIHGRGERITVDIGEPIFAGERIPTTASGEQIGIKLSLGDETVRCSAVGMGNPHCVIAVDDVANAPVERLGKLVEHHPFFPERTNVEFIQQLSRKRVKMRVWERGVGETLACGTGVCAVLAALVREGKSERRVAVECPGGEFDVHWSEVSNRISLTGAATEVYRGQIDLSILFGTEGKAL
jgi:diaminopimelate epimerase